MRRLVSGGLKITLGLVLGLCIAELVFRFTW